MTDITLAQIADTWRNTPAKNTQSSTQVSQQVNGLRKVTKNSGDLQKPRRNTILPEDAIEKSGLSSAAAEQIEKRCIHFVFLEKGKF